MRGWKGTALLLITAFISVACGPSPGAGPEEIAQTIVAEADAAVSPTPPPTATDTPAPTATQTSTPLPTNTPMPPTSTPGPLVFQDSFGQDAHDWLDCEFCAIQNGSMYMGPYPSSGAYIQHSVLCEPCGLVTNYRMSVDAVYMDGPSERGYGLLLKWTDDYLLTLEITPWQSVYVWIADFNKQEWVKISGIISGAVRTGNQTNHIEVDVHRASEGRSDISVSVNGQNVLVVFNQPADPSPVGLTLWGHALEVLFDNFEFEESEPYGVPFPGAESGDQTG